ncbi:40S ribosomal protein S6 [Paramarasmius palmivorus]|uniref:40S ribosomal protein S6 n=1 Tax=Paramarasmius palmivorus TaxID=297713 RepID=A0AAW0AWP0_9AGAR
MLKLAKDDMSELGISAVCQAPSQTRTGLVVIALVINAGFLLYHYLRRLYYPCLTLYELDNAQKSLEEVFDAANSASCLHGRESEEVTHAKLCLDGRASDIRSDSLQRPPSFWNTRLGIEIELIPRIVEWHTDAERLKKDIKFSLAQIIVERITRHRINSQLSEITPTTVDAQIVANTGREVAPQAPLRHRSRRPGDPMPEAAVGTN